MNGDYGFVPEVDLGDTEPSQVLADIKELEPHLEQPHHRTLFDTAVALEHKIEDLSQKEIAMLQETYAALAAAVFGVAELD